MAYRKATTKFVLCSRCEEIELEISEEAIGGICWICCQKAVEPPAVLIREKKKRERARRPKRPRGWQFYKVFVDAEGNVFHKGKEQPELKGTLQPTKIEKPKKKTFAEKIAEEEKNKEKLLKRYEKAKKAKERKAKQLSRKLN